MSRPTELALFVHRHLPLRPRTVRIGFVSHICHARHRAVPRSMGVPPMSRPIELALFVHQALPLRPRTVRIGFVSHIRPPATGSSPVAWASRPCPSPSNWLCSFTDTSRSGPDRPNWVRLAHSPRPSPGRLVAWASRPCPSPPNWLCSFTRPSRSGPRPSELGSFGTFATPATGPSPVAWARRPCPSPPEPELGLFVQLPCPHPQGPGPPATAARLAWLYRCSPQRHRGHGGRAKDSKPQISQPGLRPEPNLLAQRRGGAEKDTTTLCSYPCDPASRRET